VGRVLDHEQAAVAGQLVEGIHLAGMAGEVDRQDRAGPGREGLLDALEVDVQGVGSAVDDHRPGAAVDDHVGRRREGHRGDDHFVSLAEARRVGR
jgi:hypothetical protein